MQVRPLSPTSLWIDKPLSPQTLRLIWRAMVEYGLHSGKISSFLPAHFDSQWPPRIHIVEGRTAAESLALNAIVQVQLGSDGWGTRVQVEAANSKGHFDFGAAARFRVRFAAYLADFLRAVSADHDEPEILSNRATSPSDLPPPIASPTHTLPKRPEMTNEIEYVPVAPLASASFSPPLGWFLYAFGLVVIFRSEGMIWPLLVALFAWKLYQWRHGQRPSWIDIVVLVIGGLLGIAQIGDAWS